MPAKKLNSSDEKFVIDNLNQLTTQEIAEKLKVPIKTVENIISVYGSVPQQNAAWKQYLRKSPAWKQIKSQFTETEIDFFEDQYIKLMEQFKDDVLSTEHTQIYQLIKLHILMDRNLESKKRARAQIENLQRMQNGITDKYGGDVTNLNPTDRDALIALGAQISGFSAAEQNSSREYLDLGKQYTEILKLLKATRDQRVEAATGRNISFTGLVKELMNKDFQEAEGRQLELFKMSKEKELKNLGQPHTYIDNSIDLPVLSSETIDMLEKQEQEENKKENKDE